MPTLRFVLMSLTVVLGTGGMYYAACMAREVDRGRFDQPVHAQRILMSGTGELSADECELLAAELRREYAVCLNQRNGYFD
ncbi:MAG TPA: hypothetical protein VF595_14340 [Tepidisphaeraceae bacterium]|jgi:hypothetical protein